MAGARPRGDLRPVFDEDCDGPSPAPARHLRGHEPATGEDGSPAP